MNIEEYDIFRIITCQVRNHWNQIIFEEGVVTRAVFDLGWCWLARPIGKAATPRMLPKSECRELTESEKKEWFVGARLKLIDIGHVV